MVVVLGLFFCTVHLSIATVKTKTNHLRKGIKIIYQDRVRMEWSEVPGVWTARTSGKTCRWTSLSSRCGATGAVAWKGEDGANIL